ncbi:LysR family transcriptional regulator [Fodinicola feengrottensis]|uniref:LysR family transcriptional regulator n=1 Tax=Fodinicola feengrottensis TaxID=435914 RepID=UPI00244306F0|nr:LysR family transcriptional regulator [Fodinicola feengrottensis]
MELRQLSHFVAVAEQRHFTRAATQLHLTPSRACPLRSVRWNVSWAAACSYAALAALS